MLSYLVLIVRQAASPAPTAGKPLESGAVTLYSEGRWARYSDGDAVPLETHIHDDV